MTKLRITNDGRICGLWSDGIQLTELGIVQVRRASHVEFDDQRQCWYVREASLRSAISRWLRRLIGLSPDCILHRAPTRQAALTWEHDHFQPGGKGWDRSRSRRHGSVQIGT